jgi:hypothetical protein
MKTRQGVIFEPSPTRDGFVMLGVRTWAGQELPPFELNDKEAHDLAQELILTAYRAHALCMQSSTPEFPALARGAAQVAAQPV